MDSRHPSGESHFSACLWRTGCRTLCAWGLIAVAVFPLVAASDPGPARAPGTSPRPVVPLTEVLPGLWVGAAGPVELMPGWPTEASTLSEPGSAQPQVTATTPVPVQQQRLYTVLDLRTAGEGTEVAQVRAAAKAAGVGFLSVPVRRIGPPPRAAVVQLAAVLRNAEGAPVVLQCTSGNRAGDVLARYLIDSGVDVDSAIAKGRSVGLSEERAAAIRGSAFGHP